MRRLQVLYLMHRFGLTREAAAAVAQLLFERAKE